MKPTSSFSLPNSSSPALPRHLCPAAHQRTSTMATFNNGGSPVQLNPPSQVSVLDFFFPGFNGITAATEQLLAGKLNSLASFLCICGILLYLARHVSSFAWEWIDSHLSSLSLLTDEPFLTISSFQDPSPLYQ